MVEVYYVRHGQASFGQANYDKLSDLGHQQSHWLGQHFAHNGVEFDLLITGDMVRHQETASGILAGMKTHLNGRIDSRFNEFDFANIAQTYVAQHPEDAVPDGAPVSDFYRLLKKAMRAWHQQTLPAEQLTETWQAFTQRVEAGHSALLSNSSVKRILVVSSGGAIAANTGRILGVEPDTIIRLNLQIRNSSVTQVFVSSRGSQLAQFNGVAHLETPDRHIGITYS